MTIDERPCTRLCICISTVVFRIVYFVTISILMIDNQPLDTSLISVTPPLDADKHTTWRKVEIYAHKTTKLRARTGNENHVHRK